MTQLLADAAYAFRTLRSRPGWTALIVLTLAVGIGANTAMFGTLNAVLIRDLPYEEPDRLVAGRATFGEEENSVVSGYDFYDYRERARSFSSLAAATGFTVRHTVTGVGEPYRVRVARVTWDLFSTLGVGPVLGRPFAPEEGTKAGADVAIISHGTWQRHFGGSPAALGTKLVVDGRPLSVVGVMPASFHFLYDADLWRPLYRGGPYANARRWHNLAVVGRLAPGVSIAEAQSEVDVLSRGLAEQYRGLHGPCGREALPLAHTGRDSHLAGALPGEGWRSLPGP